MALMQKQYKCIISYDGTGYAGWLQQPDEPTIVHTLEDSFKRVFHKKISILGASKTDAGVHAYGQVAIFKTDLEIDAAKMQWAWNKALPESIVIRSLEHDEDFHPHYNVMNKTYWYHVAVQKPLPFGARYCWYYKLPLDVEKLKEAVRLFVGTHDFERFYKGDDRDNTVRTIESITIEFIKEYNAYRISIVGKTFLRHMVRRMVGAALHVAAGKATSEDIQAALEKKQAGNELPTAAAKGLLLYAIEYQ